VFKWCSFCGVPNGDLGQTHFTSLGTPGALLGPSHIHHWYTIDYPRALLGYHPPTHHWYILQHPKTIRTPQNYHWQFLLGCYNPIRSAIDYVIYIESYDFWGDFQLKNERHLSDNACFYLSSLSILWNKRAY
jgi:hypothetical protein